MVSFPPARNNGLLYLFASNAQKKHSESFTVPAGCGVHRVYAVARCMQDNNGSSRTWCICLLLPEMHEGTWRGYRRYFGIFCSYLRGQYGGGSGHNKYFSLGECLMKLVIGGYSQGKLNYVLQNINKNYMVFDGTLPDDAQLQEVVSQKKNVIIHRFHNWVRARILQGGNPEEEILAFLQKSPDSIIISDETGNGIVPADAF